MPKPIRISVSLGPGVSPALRQELASLGSYHRSKRLLSLAERGIAAERGMPPSSHFGPAPASGSEAATSQALRASKTAMPAARPDLEYMANLDISETLKSLSI